MRVMWLKRSVRRCSMGFSMIEVLITVVITTIGLLGVAKMQAVALSNTQVARVRSLIAIQAGSLAAAMHGNVAFWGKGTAPASFTTAAAVVTDPSSKLSSAGACKTSVCTPTQLAAYDVNDWASNMNLQFPTYTATVTCTTVTTAPVTCGIEITWAEKDVALNKTIAATAPKVSTQRYFLHVQP